MTTNDGRYVPDEEDVRTAYALEAARDTIGDTDYRAIPEARAEFDRFLTRIRQEAADQAEADRDWLFRSSRLSKEERIKANARAERAEARIKAVRDVLAHHPYGGPDQEAAIRRALDGEQ